MKKLIIVSILTLFFLNSDSYPQNSKSKFGIFSGISVNTNNFIYDDNSNYLDTSFSNDAKVTFNIGVFYLYDFVRNFGVKLQGQFTTKGGITSFTSNTISTTTIRKFKNSLNYFQFTLLPQLNLPFTKEDNNNKVFFNAGGYLSFLSGANEYYEYDNIEGEKDISGNIKNTDAGLSFGAGLIISNFFFDINYNLGLSDISNENIDQDILNIKNRSLIISLGYLGGF